MTESETRSIGERVGQMVDALATITAEEGKLTRLYLTPEHKRAAMQHLKATETVTP